MTSRDHSESIDPLDIEAVDWVVRLTVGRLSDSDRDAFEQWRATSADHDRAFAAASDLCGYLRRIPLEVNAVGLAENDAGRTVRDNVVSLHSPEQRERRSGFSRRNFLGGGAVAASLAGGLIMANPPLGLWPSLAELMAEQRTGAGQRRSFAPMAGVEVELNSRSSASRINGGQGFELISGEAFVTVAHGRPPFQVKAGGGTMGASQAAFNVQSFAGELCVTCLTGSLVVERNESRQTLSAGRELIFADNGGVEEQRADPLTRLAWRRGLLVLRRTPVADAIPQINRYFPGRLVLIDSAKSSWPVTGTFHVDQIELAVVQLERLLDVSARRLPGGVVLLG